MGTLRTLRRGISKPFEEDEVRFIQWMTPNEWRVMHALSFCFEAEELYGFQCMSTLGEQWRATVRVLAQEFGYTWKGIRVDNRGRLWPAVKEPLEENNIIWLIMIRKWMDTGKGEPPDYLVSIPAAIDYLERELPDFDLSMLRDYQLKFEEKADEVKEWVVDMPKEQREAMREELRMRHEAFRAIMAAEAN